MGVRRAASLLSTALALLWVPACSGGSAPAHSTPRSAPRHATPTSAPETGVISLTGRVIVSSSLSHGRHGCQAASSDLGVRDGGPVEVSSPKGSRIATGRLGRGVGDQLGECVLQFTVGRVPAGFRTYWISVGNQPAQRFPRASLDHPLTVDIF